jgi:hypothetical protein
MGVSSCWSTVWTPGRRGEPVDERSCPNPLTGQVDEVRPFMGAYSSSSISTGNSTIASSWASSSACNSLRSSSRQSDTATQRHSQRIALGSHCVVPSVDVPHDEEHWAVSVGIQSLREDSPGRAADTTTQRPPSVPTSWPPPSADLRLPLCDASQTALAHAQPSRLATQSGSPDSSSVTVAPSVVRL